MTLYLETSPGVFAPWTGEAIADVRHPLSIETAWAAADLAAIGLHAPAPAAAIAEGAVAVGITVERVDGVVRYVTETRPETAAETEARFAAAVQAHIDATAKSKNYTDGNSCASYATSTNATWKAEAEAFVAWRDAVWTSVYATMDAVEAGTETAPTVSALVAGLPAIAWPD